MLAVFANNLAMAGDGHDGAGTAGFVGWREQLVDLTGGIGGGR